MSGNLAGGGNRASDGTKMALKSIDFQRMVD